MNIILFNNHDLYNKIHKAIKIILILLVVLVFGYSTKSVFAQVSPSVLYVPLIGLTSVPDPLALPNGAGNVTYNYAVKNFLQEVPLTNIQVVDDICSPIKFANGDDNNNSKLDYSETWRYTCTTKLSQTTQSIATAIGHANNITATHKAYATVVVGLKNPAPLVSIINITKIAYPLSLPSEGGNITFTYKVNNPGVVPLSDVTVTDDKCRTMSGKLGDINGNNLLDTNEVWIYTCTATLKQTTTNIVTVTAFANGLKAVDDTSITVKVDTPIAPSSPITQSSHVAPSSPVAQSSPGFPNAGGNPNFKIIVWATLSGVLAALIIFFILTRKRKLAKMQHDLNSLEMDKK